MQIRNFKEKVGTWYKKLGKGKKAVEVGHARVGSLTNSVNRGKIEGWEDGHMV